MPTARVYGAEMWSFPGRGHDLMLDVGWEDVASVIDDFIRRKARPLRGLSRTAC